MVSTVKLVRMIGLERLRLLLAFHEHGTLKGAADSLHISTSAASQQLATLAREAGASLTVVDGRRLRLTDAGRVLVDHGYRLLAQLERAEGDVQAAVAGELGEITVGSYPSIIPALLVPAYQRARERHPGLRVDVREIRSPGGLDELGGGVVDLVVGVESDRAGARDDPRFTRIPLGPEDVDLAVPSGHPLTAGPAVAVADLEDVEWISTPEGDVCDELLRRACASAGYQPRVRHRAADWLAILSMVAAGMGVALLSHAVRPAVPDGVTVVPLAAGELRRRRYAVLRRGAVSRPALSAYVTVLKEVSRSEG